MENTHAILFLLQSSPGKPALSISTNYGEEFKRIGQGFCCSSALLRRKPLSRTTLYFYTCLVPTETPPCHDILDPCIADLLEPAVLQLSEFSFRRVFPITVHGCGYTCWPRKQRRQLSETFCQLCSAQLQQLVRRSWLPCSNQRPATKMAPASCGALEKDTTSSYAGRRARWSMSERNSVRMHTREPST